jgi:hypothetical protein
LLILIPFYSLRYENGIKQNDDNEASKLYDDMLEILKRLKTQGKDEKLALNLIEEIFVKICYYIGRNNKSFEGRMGVVMLDNPLELETVKLIIKGRAEGKQEDILELLEECGEINDELRKVISSQKDLEVLKSWLKAASRVDSIEEFESAIGLVK